MKQLTRVLSDIRYLTFKRSSRFGATEPGDEKKFHIEKEFKFSYMRRPSHDDHCPARVAS